MRLHNILTFANRVIIIRALAEMHELQHDPGLQLIGTAAGRALKDLVDPLSCHRALLNFLEDMEQDEIAKVRALMYAGRDNESNVVEIFCRMKDESVGGNIASIVEKTPLSAYINQGVQLAQSIGLDLEAEW